MYCLLACDQGCGQTDLQSTYVNLKYVYTSFSKWPEHMSKPYDTTVYP